MTPWTWAGWRRRCGPTTACRAATARRCIARLDQRGIHLILHKGARRDLDSYSAFFENDRRTTTGLAGYLRELEVGQVTLCGLATDYCVRYSALDAARLGFEVRVIGDACRGVDVPDDNIARALEQMRAAGISIE